MYELSTENTKLIAGGIQTYITQEWKDSQAFNSGMGTGILTSSLIAAQMLCEGFGFAAATPLIIGGGIMAYFTGYFLNTHTNALLANNTWYDIQPIRNGYQRSA